MKKIKIGLLACSLLCIIFSSCDKEKNIMRKQSGVWEIRNWQGITYNDGVVINDTSVSDMGYFSLYDSNLPGMNQVHYHLTYSPPCWTTIANIATGLDSYDDFCWWQSDEYKPDRIALEYIEVNGLDQYVVMMFTIKKLSKNKQEWIFITNGNSVVSSMGAKDVFTLERVRK